MIIDRRKIIETHLVIVTALILIFLVKEKFPGPSERRMLFIYLAAGIGLTGIFIRPLASLIGKAWFGLADVLSSISSILIMSVVYFLILVPIALIYKLGNKRMLDLKNPGISLWHKRDHEYQKKDLDTLW